MTDDMSDFGAVPHYAECPVIWSDGELKDIKCCFCRNATDRDRHHRVDREIENCCGNFQGGRMMNTVQLKALNHVLEYLYDEVKNYWEESKMDPTHIFLDVMRLKEYYDEQTKDEESPEELGEWPEWPRGWHNQADGLYEGYAPGYVEKERGRGKGQGQGGTEED